MEFPFYLAHGRRESPPKLPPFRFLERNDPAGYQPDTGLVDAVNAALLLGQPLLLTGEPGTGKTELAYHLAWSLGLRDPLVFEAKSSSTARDLFYTFDTVGRFRAAANADPLNYITYEALGEAILLANPPERVSHLLPPGFVHPGEAERTVVLIDEVDKAPRDFPNDILTEVERRRFRVPELGSGFVTASPDYWPVLVITSNSEKHLPDAFLRRCVYYNIPFPDPERLLGIVVARLREHSIRAGGRDAGGPGTPLLRDAVELFSYLRRAQLRKRPATAELLGWVEYLARLVYPDQPLRQSPEILLQSLGILLKNAEDRDEGVLVVREWLGSRR